MLAPSGSERTLADWLSLEDSKDVLQGFVDTLEEFMDVASWVGGHAAADPVVMDTIADTKAVRHHWGKAAKVNSGTGEGASGEDVVVDGSVRRVCVEVMQALAL